MLIANVFARKRGKKGGVATAVLSPTSASCCSVNVQRLEKNIYKRAWAAKLWGSFESFDILELDETEPEAIDQLLVSVANGAGNADQHTKLCTLSLVTDDLLHSTVTRNWLQLSSLQQTNKHSTKHFDTIVLVQLSAVIIFTSLYDLCPLYYPRKALGTLEKTIQHPGSGYS